MEKVFLGENAIVVEVQLHDHLAGERPDTDFRRRRKGLDAQ